MKLIIGFEIKIFIYDRYKKRAAPFLEQLLYSSEIF